MVLVLFDPFLLSLFRVEYPLYFKVELLGVGNIVNNRVGSSRQPYLKGAHTPTAGLQLND